MRKFREINQLYNIKPNTHASTDLSESIQKFLSLETYWGKNFSTVPEKSIFLTIET